MEKFHCVWEEISQEIRGGIVILVVTKVISEDKQENREREEEWTPDDPVVFTQVVL